MLYAARTRKSSDLVPAALRSKPFFARRSWISSVEYLDKSTVSVDPSSPKMLKIGGLPGFQLILRPSYASAWPGSFRNLLTSGSLFNFHPEQLSISPVTAKATWTKSPSTQSTKTMSVLIVKKISQLWMKVCVSGQYLGGGSNPSYYRNSGTSTE